MQNEGIKKAIELISYDNMTPQERAQSKNIEEAKVTLAKEMKFGEQKKAVEIAQKAISKGLDNEFISDLTGLPVEQIQQIRET